VKYCDRCHSSYPVDFTTCPKDQEELRSITELMPGLVLRGKYEILERLGAGGMGAVYKAKHVAFGEIRALKFIGSHLVSDAEFLARFKGEAVLARKLQHPNVVRIDDLDSTEDGQPFIVMEYVEGRSLRSVLRQENVLGPRRAVEIARQTCRALGAAHALGILHRDIKPENLVLVAGPGGEEVVKVLDFGLAKVLEGFEGAGQQVSTQTGMMVGTPQYMAPEQAMPDKGVELDGRVDLYSLGILLYELVTGSLPFQADTPVRMVLHHIQTRPKPPHVSHPERKVPPALSVVIMKALEKDREQRYGSALEMEQALAALLPVLPVETATSPAAGDALLPETAVRTPQPARPATPSGVAPTVPPTRERDAARPKLPSTSARRTRPLPSAPPQPMEEPRSRIGLWVGLLAIVGAAAWFAFGRGRPDPAPPPEATSVEEAATEPETSSPPEAVTDAEAPDDAAIQAEVQELLTSAPALQDARLEVAVANGIVTVSGEAPSSTARELAATLARTATGAKRVFNMVKVAPASASVGLPTPAPAEPMPSAEGSSSQPAPPSEPPKEAQIRELLDKARRQIESGDHDGAGRTFEEVLRLDPDNFVAKDALERRRAHPPPPPPPR
jgi:serine/threonine-protein kinase